MILTTISQDKVMETKNIFTETLMKRVPKGSKTINPSKPFLQRIQEKLIKSSKDSITKVTPLKKFK